MMLSGLTRLSPRNHVLDEGPDLPRESGNFGVVRPLKKH